MAQTTEVGDRAGTGRRWVRIGGALGLVGAVIGLATGDRPTVEGLLATFLVLLIVSTLPAIVARPRLRGALAWLAAVAALGSVIAQFV